MGLSAMSAPELLCQRRVTVVMLVFIIIGATFRSLTVNCCCECDSQKVTATTELTALVENHIQTLNRNSGVIPF